MNMLEVMAALKVIREAALTIEQIKTFMEAEDITEELVEQELNQTDAVINDALDGIE